MQQHQLIEEQMAAFLASAPKLAARLAHRQSDDTARGKLMTALMTSGGAALIWPAPALDRDGLLRAFAALLVACVVAALPRRWRVAWTLPLSWRSCSSPCDRHLSHGPTQPWSKAGAFSLQPQPPQRDVTIRLCGQRIPVDTIGQAIGAFSPGCCIDWSGLA
jgi:hypothetical protein